MVRRIGKKWRAVIVAQALCVVAAMPVAAAPAMDKNAARDACKQEMNWDAMKGKERSSPQAHIALQDCIKAKMKNK